MLKEMLDLRRNRGELRELVSKPMLVDFTSNDYFGFAKMEAAGLSGSTGSRLLTGNHPFYSKLEEKIAQFHHAETCLIFPSGYSANLGLISALGVKDATFLYDMDVHASLIDGMRLSYARCLPFRHNDLHSLESRLKKVSGLVYVLIESVYSISGNLAPLQEMAELCKRYGAHLIVDEAHATGPFGRGRVSEERIENDVFARIHTFSKALGCYGACIVCSHCTRDFLINYSRPFIYTTALPPAVLQAIDQAHEKLASDGDWHRNRLIALISHFRKKCLFLTLPSPIQALYYSDRLALQRDAFRLMQEGLDVRPILYPTTRKRKECLRVVLHSFNSEKEIDKLFEVLNP